MPPVLSRHWTYHLDLEDESLDLFDLVVALRLAAEAECGVLSVEGERGDWMGLEFDRSCAEVWYKRSDGFLLRPQFSDLLSRVADHWFLTREDGFSLFTEAVQRHALPTVLASPPNPTPPLPGMEECISRPSAVRPLEWRTQGHVSESD